MRRSLKIGLIVVASATIAVVSFMDLFDLPPFYRTIHVTVAQLSSLPALWVGKRVLVEGKIELALAFIPEERPPFNCIISSGSASFGVFWRNGDSSLEEQNVTIIGVVRYGTNWKVFARPEYYLEAENVFRTNQNP
jgi:hypothetical protein